MQKIGVDLYYGDARFLPLACPHCGSVENLSLDVEGYWDCDVCKRGFWISFARVITEDEPPFSRAVFEAPDDNQPEPQALTS